jgi:hypothetical protein
MMILTLVYYSTQANRISLSACNSSCTGSGRLDGSFLSYTHKGAMLPRCRLDTSVEKTKCYQPRCFPNESCATSVRNCSNVLLGVERETNLIHTHKHVNMMLSKLSWWFTGLPDRLKTIDGIHNHWPKCILERKSLDWQLWNMDAGSRLTSFILWLEKQLHFAGSTYPGNSGSNTFVRKNSNFDCSPAFWNHSRFATGISAP